MSPRVSAFRSIRSRLTDSVTRRERLRDARYARAGRRCERCATAASSRPPTTREDQSETVLLALFRGTGPAGIARHARRGERSRPAFDLARPLLRSRPRRCAPTATRARCRTPSIRPTPTPTCGATPFARRFEALRPLFPGLGCGGRARGRVIADGARRQPARRAAALGPRAISPAKTTCATSTSHTSKRPSARSKRAGRQLPHEAWDSPENRARARSRVSSRGVTAARSETRGRAPHLHRRSRSPRQSSAWRRDRGRLPRETSAPPGRVERGALLHRRPRAGAGRQARTAPVRSRWTLSASSVRDARIARAASRVLAMDVSAARRRGQRRHPRRYRRRRPHAGVPSSVIRERGVRRAFAPASSSISPRAGRSTSPSITLGSPSRTSSP